MQVPFVFDDVKCLRKRNEYGALVKTFKYQQKLKEWYVWLNAQRVADAKRYPYPKYKTMVVRTWNEIYNTNET